MDMWQATGWGQDTWVICCGASSLPGEAAADPNPPHSRTRIVHVRLRGGVLRTSSARHGTFPCAGHRGESIPLLDGPANGLQGANEMVQATRARVLLLGLALAPLGCGARTGFSDAAGDTTANDAGAADSPGAADDGGASDAAVAAALDGLRWELPCTSDTGDPTACQTLPSASASATMGGVPGATYDVTLRFRGIVEISTFVGGSANGYWQIGGGPPDGSTINVYGLDITAPTQTCFVNQGVSHRVVVPLDYTETVPVAAGATVTLHADSRDSYELRNLDGSGQPLVVPGVPPAPRAFDGQFVQMEVVSVARQ